MTKDTLRILLVEDNPIDAEMVHRRLDAELAASFRITHVATLGRAQAALAVRSFDLVILDLSLPDSDGLATLRAIKAVCGATPVAVISAVLEESARSALLAAGAQDVIPKDAPAGRAFSLCVLYVVERHRALARSRRIDALLATMPDAVIVTSTGGMVRYMNEAACALFGRTRPSFLGQPLPFPLGREGPVEIRIERRGEPRVCELRSVRFEWEGEPAILALIRDLTDHLRLDELRVQAAQLENENSRIQIASQLKSDFLAIVSHELRTPLNAIIGFTELLCDGAVEPTSSEHADFLGRILASGRHLLQLVNDVLDLSKIESGKMDFRPEDVDLAALVREVAAILGPSAAQSQVSLELDPAPSLAGLHLDPARFKQILYNYLSNAIKFTPEGGRVIIRTRAVDDQCFRLEVEDTGIGIRPADVDRLFVDFLQLESGARRQPPGTGLGLALTRRLVEAQGGTVGVRSTLGVGSVFHAVLPRRHVPLAAMPGGA